MRFEYIISLAIMAIFLASFIATSAITGMQAADNGAGLATVQPGSSAAWQQQQASTGQAAALKKMQEQAAKRTAEQKKKSEALKKIMGGMKK